MSEPKKKRRQHRASRLPQILAISGLLLVVFTILSFKEKPQTNAVETGSNELPEAQLDRALAEHHPTLAFFHSTDCQQCIIMMDTIA